jgi:hypothetical protein
MNSLMQQATLVILGLAFLTFMTPAAEAPANITTDKAPPAQWPAMATVGDP